MTWGVTTFPAHEAVVCLRCQTPLGSVPTELIMTMLGVGSHNKRCLQCKLMMSYDVSPAEASAVELDEPDWQERFEQHCARFPRLPRYLQEDSAFESTMQDWRRYHKATIDGKDTPATAYEAMVALAKLGIMPPRNLIKDVERTSACFQEQHDDMMWLTMSQRAWRIIAIESRVMFLESFGEQTQVDLTKAKWDKWREKALEALEAAYPQIKKDPPTNATTSGDPR